VFRFSDGGEQESVANHSSAAYLDACIGWATDGLADLAATPLDRPAEQAMIREALKLLRPRSGRLADVPAEMLTLLFGEVSKVLAMPQADRSTSPLIEALERSFESFKKHPADRDALLQLLEILADFSEPVDRWWRAENEKPAVVF
jgi:hypothetical protein